MCLPVVFKSKLNTFFTRQANFLITSDAIEVTIKKEDYEDGQTQKFNLNELKIIGFLNTA